jgi:acetylornithine deacetylase/succinyl-diaminopimelate desuccinylase-like protein
MDQTKLNQFIEDIWREEAVPVLVDYIRIPNKSPAFDSDWAVHGHMEKAVALLSGWARERLAKLPGATLEIVRLPERTPVILIEIPASDFNKASDKAQAKLGRSPGDTVLLYGHLDKQPEMAGWAEGYGPWIPRLEGERLYGRGGADDGYAILAALSAVTALADQRQPHARCVILIEACEESGSYDLPFYVEHLAQRLGSPSLVVCLDSGCGNYDQLWVTTSLRGTVSGTLTVRVLEEGVHSGDASGVVPSSFRLLRQLISRLEDETTGAILPEELQVQVPAERIAQARTAASALGPQVYAKFPFVPGMKPASDDLVELVLNRTWRPQLAIIGAEGMPAVRNAGNVLLPYTSVKLSLRLPPTLPAADASQVLRRLLAKDPPYGAHVTFESLEGSAGWNAPALAPWLEASLAAASQSAFGKPPAYMGEGGSIPFMAMLGARFPTAQFVVTGVLGPHSNAHGPNEFLHIPTAKRVSAVVARVLADHRARKAA